MTPTSKLSITPSRWRHRKSEVTKENVRFFKTSQNVFKFFVKLKTIYFH